MKIKLPANADVRESRTGLETVLVKMSGLEGWDIANKLAEENNMKIVDFCIVTNVGVYCDHVVMNRSDIA